MNVPSLHSPSSSAGRSAQRALERRRRERRAAFYLGSQAVEMALSHPHRAGEIVILADLDHGSFTRGSHGDAPAAAVWRVDLRVPAMISRVLAAPAQYPELAPLLHASQSYLATTSGTSELRGEGFISAYCSALQIVDAVKQAVDRAEGDPDRIRITVMAFVGGFSAGGALVPVLALIRHAISSLKLADPLIELVLASPAPKCVRPAERRSRSVISIAELAAQALCTDQSTGISALGKALGIPIPPVLANQIVVLTQRVSTPAEMSLLARAVVDVHGSDDSPIGGLIGQRLQHFTRSDRYGSGDLRDDMVVESLAEVRWEQLAALAVIASLLVGRVLTRQQERPSSAALIDVSPFEAAAVAAEVRERLQAEVGQVRDLLEVALPRAGDATIATVHGALGEVRQHLEEIRAAVPTIVDAVRASLAARTVELLITSWRSQADLTGLGVLQAVRDALDGWPRDRSEPTFPPFVPDRGAVNEIERQVGPGGTLARLRPGAREERESTALHRVRLWAEQVTDVTIEAATTMALRSIGAALRAALDRQLDGRRRSQALLNNAANRANDAAETLPAFRGELSRLGHAFASLPLAGSDQWNAYADLAAGIASVTEDADLDLLAQRLAAHCAEDAQDALDAARIDRLVEILTDGMTAELRPVVEASTLGTILNQIDIRLVDTLFARVGDQTRLPLVGAGATVDEMPTEVCYVECPPLSTELDNLLIARLDGAGPGLTRVEDPNPDILRVVRRIDYLTLADVVALEKGLDAEVAREIELAFPADGKGKRRPNLFASPYSQEAVRQSGVLRRAFGDEFTAVIPPPRSLADAAGTSVVPVVPTDQPPGIGVRPDERVNGVANLVDVEAPS